MCDDIVYVCITYDGEACWSSNLVPFQTPHQQIVQCTISRPSSDPPNVKLKTPLCRGGLDDLVFTSHGRMSGATRMIVVSR